MSFQPVRSLRARGGHTNDGRNTCLLRGGSRARWGRASGLAYAPGKTTALGEVLSVAWVVGVGCPPDLDMTFDSGAGHPVKGEHTARSLLPVDPYAEKPLLSRRREVFMLLPGSEIQSRRTVFEVRGK